MPVIEGTKFACCPCIRGHRSTTCNHSPRMLWEVRKRGRPLQDCPHHLNDDGKSCNCCERKVWIKGRGVCPPPAGVHPPEEVGRRKRSSKVREKKESLESIESLSPTEDAPQTQPLPVFAAVWQQNADYFNLDQAFPNGISPLDVDPNAVTWNPSFTGPMAIAWDPLAGFSGEPGCQCAGEWDPLTGFTETGCQCGADCSCLGHQH